MNELMNIFKKVTDTVSDGIILIDKDYKVTFANAMVLRLFGSNNNTEYPTCHSLFHRLASPCHETYPHKPCPLNDVLKTGKPDSVTSPFILRSGEKRIFNVTASPVKDKNNDEVIQVVKILKDITEKIKIESLLKEFEYKYRNLVDNALIGVYKTNLKGDIIYANKALAKMLEFKDPGKLMNSNVRSRYKNPKDRETLINKLKDTGRVCDFEVELVTRKNKIIHVLLNANLDGEMLSGMIMDITERNK